MKKSLIEKPTVVLHYLSYIHYRRSLFEKLSSEDSPVKFHLICGDDSPYGVRSFKMPPTHRVKNFTIGPFIWQFGLLRKTLRIKPDVVVLLGVNPFMISSFLNFLYFKLRGTKVVWWGHGTLGNQGVVGKKLRLLFYRMASGSMVYSPSGKKRLEAHNIDPTKVFTLGNCINTEDYGISRLPQLARDSSGFRKNSVLKLLFTGRLTKGKQVELLIESLSNLKPEVLSQVELKIIGDGPEKNKLEQKTKDLMLNKHITFLGELYGDKVEKYFLEADFFVHPGSIGLAVFHALSYGLPVITHDNFDNQKPEAEVLDFEGNDLLIKEGSINSLIEKLTSLNSLNVERYKKLTESSIALAQKNMPISVFKAFVKAIESVI